MNRTRILFFVMMPLTLSVVLTGATWIIDKTFWYFRGYEYYSDWVYPGLAEPNIKMRESGDSSREFIFDTKSNVNSISLNEFGDRQIPCKNPTVIGLGDSQIFGSGLSDNETFPAHVFSLGGPCIYNAGRHSILDALRNPSVRVNKVLVTSTERDGFVWYCKIPPSEWDLSPASSNSFVLKQNFSLRVAAETALKRTLNVLRGKIQNGMALRIVAPETRLVKYQHVFNNEDLQQNIDCLRQMNNRFNQEGIEATFMLFPAVQTMYPEAAPREVDEFTLMFIITLSKLALDHGIDIVDSQKCLSSGTGVTHQIHDTHLSSDGMKALAECYVLGLRAP